MLTIAGAGLRTICAPLVVLLLVFAGLPFGWAHEGHDHGTPETPVTRASPRVVATSEAYQLVGIVEGEVLVIYLDRQADNTPVLSATLDVAIDGETKKAELLRNGTYEVVSPTLRAPGSHEILITLTDGATSDLLVGAVVIPQPQAETQSFDHSLLDHARQLVPASGRLVGWTSGGLLLLAGLAMLAVRRSPLAIGISVAGILVFAATAAIAGPGHDHGPPTLATAGNGNAPQRQPDGSIFLPKPTQRLLEVRTAIVAPGTTTRAVKFVGRVIANPNRSGVVQSAVSGRFMPPVNGVLNIGSVVKAGDLLGSIAPSFVAKDASDMRQTMGELDQQIALARTKLARQEALLRTDVVSPAAVEETRIQLKGYEERRRELLEARVQPEELRAPVDGVITAARVVAGQVVSQSDVLFSIVDPSSLMVEALVFDQASAEQIDKATATTSDGVQSRLRMVGRSRTLQQQYSVLKFELLEPSPALNVGTPVIITAQAGNPVTGIIVPRAAIAQAPNGQMVVFRHREPELFEPKAVRFQPFDAQSVLIEAGLEAGDKIVVQGAPLVNQVR